MTRREKAQQLLATLKEVGGRCYVRGGKLMFTAPPGSVTPAFIRETQAWRRAIEDELLDRLLTRWLAFEPEDVRAALSSDVKPLWPDGVPGEVDTGGL